MLAGLRKKLISWVNPHRKTGGERERELQDLATAQRTVRNLELRVALARVQRIQRKA